MSVLPLKFEANSVSPIENLTFNHSFDTITEVKGSRPTKKNSDTSETYNPGLSINQIPKIPAFLLNLGGRSSKPNMALSVNGRTYTYHLNCAYITQNFPEIKIKTNIYSFVLEGFYSDDIVSQKILIFIPLNLFTKGSKGNDPFKPLHEALTTNATPPELNLNSYNISIDLNTFIPDESFYYYNYVDSSKTEYKIVAFEQSNLYYDSIFSNILEDIFRDVEYDVKLKDTAVNTVSIFSSMSTPTVQDAIEKSFEDNIYIDCQPTNTLGQPKDNYMKKALDEADGILDYFEKAFPYIFFIIVITLLVIFIFLLNKFKDIDGNVISIITSPVRVFGSMFATGSKPSVKSEKKTEENSGKVGTNLGSVLPSMIPLLR